MTGFRPPIVAGVSGGVGTTTVALALHGTDAGTTTADADVLVCRSSAESLDRAARIADLAEPGRYPVLVVTLAGTERRPPPRVTDLEGYWAAVVAAPHVPRWAAIVDPYREVAGLLGSPRDQLPRALRGYLEALTRAARLVADSGRLTAPRPTPSLPTTPPTRRQPSPVEPVHRPFVPALPIPAATTEPGPPADRQVVRLMSDSWTATVPPPGHRDPGSRSTGLSTMESTGCGELPELRPVRGIRVLTVGGAT
ncbi:hypothetical protein [Pseudonocardia xishanensis]|uniref:Uncharacterized protein n=1 Tax=Pseudonocardia xishanensis TaxID=630995 RepID=A0ABP8RDN2_9PSEU